MRADLPRAARPQGGNLSRQEEMPSIELNIYTKSAYAGIPSTLTMPIGQGPCLAAR